MNYYNEWDPYAAARLRQLIANRLIPPGDVDERSITDVCSKDLRGYVQCHFFAGIGGWPLALQLAGWPEDRPVWTGSFPCQPFSQAGRGMGFEDERHLWPFGYQLIKECRPDTIIGEQVTGAIRKGWIDRVFGDLEEEGYACASLVLGAKYHQRKRVFWVADAKYKGMEIGRGASYSFEKIEDTSRICKSLPSRMQEQKRSLVEEGKERRPSTQPYWKREPEPPWVVDDVPARMVRVRGYGNAIIPPVAAEFIKAYMSLTTTPTP